MDLCFKRYASPCLIIDLAIDNGRFTEFVNELLKINNDEADEKTLWEMWLHKSYGQSYNDFVDNVMQEEPEPLSREELEATIDESRTILDGFIPS